MHVTLQTIQREVLLNSSFRLSPTLRTCNIFSEKRNFAPHSLLTSDLKDKAAHPSETQIDCDHKSKTCIEATAEYRFDHPHVFLNYFEVVKWDENGIVATSDSAVCITETLLISFGDKSVSNTHSAKTLDNDKKEACKFLGFVGTETDRFIIKNSDQWIADPYGSKENRGTGKRVRRGI